jgi:amidase
MTAIAARLRGATGGGKMRSSDIVNLEGRALAGAIESREISCVEVMQATLDQIDRFNPRVNAIVALRDREALIAEARERDASLARGEAVGPLHGVPLAIKDLAAVKGLPQTKGSLILKDFVAQADSIFVERLRAAGALLIGKTNTPEFGLGSQTFNPVYGATRNAYDPRRTAGGSSGGAAVALALRMVALADGSDYGGSLRNPAGWNDVFGFRPSIGRVPNDGIEPWLPSMSVLGPMARSVADLAFLLSVMAGYDAREPLSQSGDGAAFRGALDADLRGKRIAWAGDFGGALPFEAGILEPCRQALKTFEGLGCTIEEARPDFSFEALWGAWLDLRSWQTAFVLLPYYRDSRQRALMKPEAIYEIERALELSAFDISAASQVRASFTAAMRRVFERYDALVLPTAQVHPFAIETPWPHEIAGRTMRSYHEWMASAVPATMSGGPTLAAPAGFASNGLPVGIQIIGPPRGDLALLQLGQAYDLATRWPQARPPPMLDA